ncbi:MAG TPA: hypothetical protein VE152_10890 [Acidimicrobiales bacterium]|nr:hypothetical protein [Acidimicrobiales bacterium]
MDAPTLAALLITTGVAVSATVVLTVAKRQHRMPPRQRVRR